MRAISLFSVGLILFLIGAHSAPGATLPESCRELTAPTGSDGFGRSVSLDGETALVGAYGEDCAAGQDCGAAYVFRFNGTDWVGEAKLTASDADQADSFGWCVSLDGHIALVGAYGEDCAAGQDCGAAYVFRFNGTDWVEEAKLAAADADQADSFGWSVALDGDTAVVGAYGDDCAAGSDCGSAYVFRFDGVNWNQEAKLTATAAKHGDSFGRSVSLDGGKVLVGAPFDCSDGCGAAYVFGFDGNDWAEEAKLSGDGEFGAAVSIDGERALVGAPAYNIAELPGYSVPAGAVYVFRFDGANWGEEVLRTASDPHYDSSFGASVSLDGEAALVGAPYLEVPPAVINGEYRGAYLFRVYNAEWMGNARLTATDVADEDFVSRSVSLDGDLALIGASDSAYVCTFSFPALANPPMPCPSGSPGDRYSRFGCFGTSFFGGQETAIRVRIAKMYNTNAGDSSGASVCPPGRDGAGLPALEQLEGQVRYLGVPDRYVDNSLGREDYIAVPLVCDPADAHVRDWSHFALGWDFRATGAGDTGARPTHVFFYGSAVAPCSVYEMQQGTVECMNGPDPDSCLSDVTQYFTAIMGDTAPPRGSVNFLDIQAQVKKFKGLMGAEVEPHALLRGNIVGEPPGGVLQDDTKVNFTDIVRAVDAFKQLPYREVGPCDPETGTDDCGNPCDVGP